MRLIALAAVLMLSACSLPGSSGPGGGKAKRSAEEKLLAEAFSALKAKDWEAFSALTVTTADYDMKEMNTPPLLERQTFSGGVMKPEQQMQIRDQFTAVVDEEVEGTIQFDKAEFVSKGKVVMQGAVESLSGQMIPYRVYSIRIEVDGETIDTRDMSPRFVIVKFNGRPRILALDIASYYSEGGGESAEAEYEGARPMPLENGPAEEAPYSYDDGEATFSEP